jgi:hypothetical protein
MKNPWGRIIAVPIAGLALYACTSSGPTGDTAGSLPPNRSSGGTCEPGRQGCACGTDGASIACGEQVSQSGDYVTCAMGSSTCQGGTWGPCVGNTLVTRSLAGTTLGGSGGLRTLSVTQACDDKCDPNQCLVTTSDGHDVDASISLVGDSAVTLLPPQVAGCQGTQCQIAYDCPAGSPTTLTGVVRDPAGVNPVYNAMVYIPVSTGDLPPFTTGASCDSCSGTQAVQAVAVAQTAADGSFTLTYVPSTDVAPQTGIPLVVQLGKWRRKVVLPSVPKCTTTPVPPDDSRLPRNAHDGFDNVADMPRMAITTGDNDPMECLLLKMGIDPAEFEIPNAAGPGHVDFFRGNGLDLAPGAPDGSQLYGQTSELMPYDLVLLPCQGPNDSVGAMYSPNLSAYLNAGGRAFLTHYSYSWLTQPGTNPYLSVANWDLNNAQYSQALDTTIDTGSTKGQAFASWLTDVGASTTPGHLTISSARHDVDQVNPPATEWIHDSTAPNEPFYFSFDTPLGATAPPPDAGPDAGGGACGRVVFSDFHVSTADLVTSGNCTTTADCGFTATCNGAGGGQGTCVPWPCGYTFDCPDTYTCQGSVGGTCVELSACRINEDCQTGNCQNGTCVEDPNFVCFEPWQCGDTEQCTHTYGACVKSCATNADCTAGELCTNGSCTGCLDGSYCQSGVCNGAAQTGKCSATGDDFPLKCQQGPLTPQEDALEFMLLDLTSCDTAPPPPVVQTYAPLTFTEDFTSTCPKNSKVIWRELDWQAVVPSTASIVFSAQTAASPVDGGAPDWTDAAVVPVATATTSTTLPGSDVQFLDTGSGSSGVFNTATPPVFSSDNLRLTITLSPTSDRAGAPTLLDWSVKADCVASE